ncbi:hypothetical protein SAMD00019534_065010, partial [Acytostelium subglobosum LB1]|uniref:hypothetical protein n=1 Tax=Acytostelium subglobosum LB1 TaxID=1410327 RepID=UPI000644952E
TVGTYKNDRYLHTGVGLVKPLGSTLKADTLFADRLGRTLLVRVNEPNYTITILLVYAPASNAGRLDFVTTLQNSQAIFDNDIDVIAGDFNTCATDRDDFTLFINELAALNDLVDTGAHDNIPTHKSLSRGTEKRLDRLYVRSTLVGPHRAKVDVSHAHTKSDHHPVLITVYPKQITPTGHRWILRKETLASPAARDLVHGTLSRITPSGLSTWLSIKEALISRLKAEQARNAGERRRIIVELKRYLARPPPGATPHRLDQSRLADLLESAKVEKEAQRRDAELGMEMPSKYLTRIAKGRKTVDLITEIYGEDGAATSDPPEIRKAFHSFYSKLYTKGADDADEHERLLSHWSPDCREHLQPLEEPITADEVLSAISTTDTSKSPGPDGLTGQFYVTHAEVLAPFLATTFNNMLLDPETITSDFKCGIIHTIFKKGDRLDIANRRPITLLNVDYKLLSKVINARLTKLLDSLINPLQNGFVPERLIHDNTILLQEVIDTAAQDMATGYVTLFDFQKAFDSISHDSIERTLRHVGIPPLMVGLVMALLRGSVARVSVNGILTDALPLDRGTKQGDPLSPTLFVLVIEALAAAINADQSIVGLPVSPPLKVKLLQFADDTAALTRSLEELLRVIEWFKVFCKATSSAINVDKSVHIVLGDAPTSELPYPVATEPERYLGVNFTKQGIYSKFKTLISSLRGRLALQV